MEYTFPLSRWGRTWASNLIHCIGNLSSPCSYIFRSGLHWKNSSSGYMLVPGTSISRADSNFLFLDTSCQQVHQRHVPCGCMRPGEVIWVLLSAEGEAEPCRRWGLGAFGPRWQRQASPGLWMSFPGRSVGKGQARPGFCAGSLSPTHVLFMRSL